MRQYIRQSKLSTTTAEEANKEPVPKKAKILPDMKKLLSRSFCRFYEKINMLLFSFLKLFSN